jgi:hypothetical protein
VNNKEEKIWNDQIKPLYCHLPGGNEENHENSISGQLVCQMIFELHISWYKFKSVIAGWYGNTSLLGNTGSENLH